MSHDWRPSASLESLSKRAALLQQVRAFFHARRVMEVETPVLSAAGNTDININSFTVHYDGPHAPPDGQMYLHTSPEYAMKRLLAAGSGDIFQIARVFRNSEAGRRHNPEFTLLEWYRLGMDQHALMAEVEALLRVLMPGLGKAIRLSYRQAFIEHAGIDPLEVEQQALQACAERHGLGDIVGLDKDDHDAWLDLCMDQVVVPALGEGLVFIYDYPASQAALARLSEEDARVAERFECFINGVELANGFHELTDAREQRQRLLADNAHRRLTGRAELPVDEHFLSALQSGLPDCAGVAVGLDRLLMLMSGATAIDEVLAFAVDRA